MSDYEIEVNRWCEKFAEMEVARGKMTKEEMPYVLTYWKRINKLELKDDK